MYYREEGTTSITVEGLALQEFRANRTMGILRMSVALYNAQSL